MYTFKCERELKENKCIHNFTSHCISRLFHTTLVTNITFTHNKYILLLLLFIDTSTQNPELFKAA